MLKYIFTDKVNNNDILKGYTCLTEPNELYTLLAKQEDMEITILNSFSDKYFTKNGLTELISNTKKLNSNINIILEKEEVINKNIMDLSKVTTSDEMIYKLLNNEREFFSTIQVLYDNYKRANNESLIANNKISTLHLLNQELSHKLEEKDKVLSDILNIKNELESKLETIVSRVNYKYERNINPETMFNLETNSFTKILYIKEFTRVRWVDTLLYYLQEILKTLYSMPTRLVVIEPPFSYNRNKLYPNCKPSYNLTYNDVYNGDIFMTGVQERLLEDILRNPSSINYLIILDRSGYTSDIIDSYNVEKIYCASSTQDVLIENVSMDRIISYSSTTLNIPFIPGFTSLSLEERLQKYSSMPILQKILDIVERR